MFRTAADSTVYDRATENELVVHFKETHYNPSGNIYTLQMQVSLSYAGLVYEDTFDVVSHGTLGEKFLASASGAKKEVTSKVVSEVIERVDEWMTSQQVTIQGNNTPAS